MDSQDQRIRPDPPQGRRALRSGDRRIAEFAAGTNRAYADNLFCHFAGAGKVKGLGVVQGSGDTPLGDSKACLPLYWDGIPSMVFSSSSNMDNFLLDYYLTGYRRAKDNVVDYGEGVKEYWTPAKAKRCWRGIMAMRQIAQTYALTWDPALRALADATADTFVDDEGELGLTKNRPYKSSSYKTQVDIATRALFHFNGNVDGESYGWGKPLAARLK